MPRQGICQLQNLIERIGNSTKKATTTSTNIVPVSFSDIFSPVQYIGHALPNNIPHAIHYLINRPSLLSYQILI
jgi:hypothetical protein